MLQRSLVHQRPKSQIIKLYASNNYIATTNSSTIKHTINRVNLPSQRLN